MERHAVEPRLGEVEPNDALARVFSEPPALSLFALAVPSAVHRARAALRGFAQDLGLPAAVLDAADVAVAEAIANAVQHAYAHDELGTVEMNADFQHGTLEVVVCDRGRGMPSADPDKLHFGLPLMAELSDGFTIGEARPRGVEVWMRFLAER